MDDLCFAYGRAGPELFGGLTHRFAAGRVTAVTGPSGRGKSTLLYLLGLMLQPTQGAVSLRGEDLSRLSDADRARRRATEFGFVFQDAALDPTRPILDSVVEPALYAGARRAPARARAVEMLERVGLGEWSSHRPGQISGGQAQRAGIARALVNDPAVILADEPTGNLDRGNASVILRILAECADAGRSVIIVTHDPFVIDQADAVLDLATHGLQVRS